MAKLTLLASVMLAFCLLLPKDAHAQGQTAGDGQPPMATVSCASKPGARTQCPAVTAAGVALIKSTGSAACLLGKTWGYDDKGVWVMDGCSGEFALGQAGAPAVPPPTATPVERIETWGEFDPGDGFLLGRGPAGELSISAYALLRYLNQMPGEQIWVDHLGNEHTTDGRNDIFPHRVIVYLKGWVGLPKLMYTIVLWTVNTTDQDALFGVVGYQFGRRFSLYGGINGSPGTRSLQGSHPYWLGHDRVMADEFFRPYFAFGTWAQGEVSPGLWYNAFVGNNSSSLGITAAQLDRTPSTGFSMWWMPSTREFGPRGAYGDWEMHETIATRFGFSTTLSEEERFTNGTTGATGNTTIKLADGLNIFDPGALAPGVTVQEIDYAILSLDAGIKYRGMFFQTEVYTRWLDKIDADGPLPVSSILDKGFFIQGAFYPVPKKLELYAATSQIYGDKDAGFSKSSEYLAGFNFYPASTRDHRLNLQVIDVNRSPVGSTFGYYTTGQDGTTLSIAFSVFF